MLMTMEHECKEAYERFPNEERLDKVKWEFFPSLNVPTSNKIKNHLIDS